MRSSRLDRCLGLGVVELIDVACDRYDPCQFPKKSPEVFRRILGSYQRLHFQVNRTATAFPLRIPTSRSLMGTATN